MPRSRHTLSATAAAVCVVIGMSACGGSASGPTTTITRSVAAASTGYHNMSTLGADVQHQLWEQNQIGTGDTVSCMSTGANTADCYVNSGAPTTLLVDISADGTSYVTR